ncbi:RNA pyrophosphohydrolase [Neomegalonema sp.]|uniref:RNA pyrophosphohydrolase n=1 Tax=Neomegalonema sp. TaxID=2039713 RepID=UPI0026119B75|nr:RNA pyrophosphohydrolase [Neomegalonema sp.]MDD2869551.1 RNA pyrophosphohydrolase [Neomegalonema sp.]
MTQASQPDSARDLSLYRPCVGVALINREGLIFAGRRLDTPDAWQMPQGGLDKGETPLEGGLRELREETGVKKSRVEVLALTEDWISYDLPDHLMGKVWGGKWRGQKQKWLALRFLGADSDVDITREPVEFSEWRWMKPEDLLAGMVSFKREVYVEVLKRFTPHFRPS